MNIIQPTKDQIMEFFRNHSDFQSVLTISQLLVAHDHNNVQDEEWKHVKSLLHQLKADNFLIIENEGKDIYNEKFSSTPDRIDMYFNKKHFPDTDDLTIKTDDELREIMRERIINQHSPASLYHKAKQELEFRQQKKLEEEKKKRNWFSMDNPLTYIVVALLLIVIGLIFHLNK
ncbi:MAG TPA: hypothetical protein VG621_01740 [Candidatus Paceibacterota bacterium]|nr:hypothetical protein [Candidatus Paceibacterota bacterium]